jgi:hypothetical protein
MTTYIFILIMFSLGLYLMRQHGRYEKEREALLREVKKLFEALGREITLFCRSPKLLSLEGELPVLASHGFFRSLRASGDFGAALSESLPHLPLPHPVALLLSHYAEDFGVSDRTGEARAVSDLMERLSPVLEEEVGATKTRLRTFRIVTVALLLSVAILLC